MTPVPKLDEGTRRYPAMSAGALRAERSTQTERSRQSARHPVMRVVAAFVDLGVFVLSVF